MEINHIDRKHGKKVFLNWVCGAVLITVIEAEMKTTKVKVQKLYHILNQRSSLHLMQIIESIEIIE